MSKKIGRENGIGSGPGETCPKPGAEEDRCAGRACDKQVVRLERVETAKRWDSQPIREDDGETL